MKWTTEPPRIRGWYFWQVAPGERPHIIELRCSAFFGGEWVGTMDGDDFSYDPDETGKGRWCGPIEEPPE